MSAPIEDEIRKAVNSPRKDAPRDDEFEHIRAEVHGALWRAWSRLVPDGRVMPVDVRINDIVDEWLQQKRRGSP